MCRLQRHPPLSKEGEVEHPAHATGVPLLCLRETQGRSPDGGQAPFEKAGHRPLSIYTWQRVLGPGWPPISTLPSAASRDTLVSLLPGIPKDAFRLLWFWYFLSSRTCNVGDNGIRDVLGNGS